MSKTAVPQSVFESLERSGFPFQTAVRHVLRRAQGLAVHASEYPWRGHDDRDNFIDIVARSNEFILTIECKKTTKETLTFLRPLGEPTTTRHIDDFRGVRAEYFAARGHLEHSYETWKIWPSSPSCEFCIVGTNKSERLLERDASLIIRATDALIQDRREYSDLYQKASVAFFLPIIVTNAEMYSAIYDPSKVSLKTGKFTSTAQVEPAPWVRFTKSFTALNGRILGTEVYTS
jgi:hypothetical protein